MKRKPPIKGEKTIEVKWSAPTTLQAGVGESGVVLKRKRPKKFKPTYQTYWKICHIWDYAPIGFWDTGLYWKFQANIRCCFELNPKFLQLL